MWRTSKRYGNRFPTGGVECTTKKEIQNPAISKMTEKFHMQERISRDNGWNLDSEEDCQFGYLCGHPHVTAQTIWHVYVTGVPSRIFLTDNEVWWMTTVWATGFQYPSRAEIFLCDITVHTGSGELIHA
jgi:hypothetical protein